MGARMTRPAFAGGNWLLLPSVEEMPRTGVDRLMILGQNGGEVAYWDHEEWGEDPAFVMGAIWGAILQVGSQEAPE